MDPNSSSPDEVPPDLRHVCLRVLSQYNRAVVHLRQRFRSGRFGLVFGAGVSRPFGLPGWGELLDRVGVRVGQSFEGVGDLLRRAQLLFQHYAARWPDVQRHVPDGAPQAEPTDHLTREDVIRIDWLHLVRDCLYQNATEEKFCDALKCSFLTRFLPLIKNTPLTINYNFDDVIQRLALAVQGSPTVTPTFWDANAQTPSGLGSLYHPNGFLPRELEAKQPSQDLVLLQAAFADQLIDSSQGRYSLLSTHLSSATCLLIGLSLEDPSLRHLLRVSLQLHPGHIHYFVRYVRDATALSAEHRNAETQSNFAVYNLVTLFLTDVEIAALGLLLSVQDGTFDQLVVDAGGRRQFVYYLVGSSGVGKTTALRQMHSFRTHEEWLDTLPYVMTVPFTRLTVKQMGEVEDWVDDQWRKKNEQIAQAGVGIDVVDRGPLDALAYVPDDEGRCSRAKHALETISTPNLNLVQGQVIRLHGSCPRVYAQARRAFRNHDADSIDRQQNGIESVYQWPYDSAAVCDICIDDSTPAEVARQIARVIHLGEYHPFPMQERLEQFAAGGRSSG